MYGVMGAKPLDRILCFLSKYLKVDAVILLGDIVSPLVVYRIARECGIRTLGVLGVLDNPAVSQALRAVSGLLECRWIDVKGVGLFGVGISACSKLSHGEVDVLVSSRPGVKDTCCDQCVDWVDSIVAHTSPRVVLVGSCSRPCIRETTISPGSFKLGFFGLLNIDRQSHAFTVYQIDSYLLRLVGTAGAII